jgi:hypothetical protein
MELLKSIPNEKLPSVINDPFKKTQVTSISVDYEQSIWSFDKGKWSATGRVKFKNGNTEGSQKFEGQTFDEVVLKIKSMIENLE